MNNDYKRYATIDYIEENCAKPQHDQSASSITEGTFQGSVVASPDAQTPNVSLLRNSILVPEETDPINNGEICWTYE